jgi:sarcosine oxidase, subunit gamma
MDNVQRADPRGMITLRGDLAAVAGALGGLPLPGIGQITTMGDRALAWMSPDELLLMLPPADVTATLGQMSQSLQGVHHLAADVTDARALFALTGPDAREVIAKLSPADLHPSQFGPGQMRRTRLGQVAAAFWMQEDRTIMVICFRSVADYVAALLAQSAKDGPVGYFR